MNSHLLGFTALFFSLAAFAAPPKPSPLVEDAAPELPPGITRGPAKVKLGTQSELDVPEGAQFGDAATTRRILEESGNLTSGKEMGILLNDEASVIFDFDSIGFVKDADKEALDADKILESLRAGQDEANKELTRLGRPNLELAGWKVLPHYDPTTQNLEWGILVQNKETKRQSVNYNVRLLGRRGVVEATLLVSPERLENQLTWFRKALSGHKFIAGEDYASWRSGDKVAAYGLAALVTGGVVAAAAKSGFLAKAWKFILIGLVALGGAVKKLFGGNKASRPSDT